MTERDRVAGFDDEAVGERLGPAGPQVGIERAGTGSRAADRARRGSAGVDLEGGGHGRQLVRRQRPLGQRDEPQDAPAFLRPDREPGDDEVVERPGQRCAGELPPGGEQLLGHERRAARSFGHQQEQAGRRPLALDPLDQGGQLVPIERRDDEPPWWLRPGHDRIEIRRPRVVPGDDVGLRGPDDDQALIAGDPGQERDDRPCRGVREMQVLDHEDDRVPLPEPAEQTEDALERPRLAPLGGGRAAAAGRSADRVEARRQVGQQAHDLGRGRAEQVGQDRVGQRPERRTDGPHDRAVGLVDAGGPGGSPEHGHRLAQGADPGDRLVEQAGHPDPGRPVDQDGPRPAVRGIVEGRREIGERLFATHEPGARIPDRHAGIIRAASARLDPDDGPPALAPPRQHAQRAARRGVALLHQVAAHDGLPVRARARRAQGPWRQQAAAPDGPAHRVLQSDGRARARPVRRGRRHAARGGHRQRPAAGDRHRARAALGGHLRSASCATCPPSATVSVRSSPTSAPRIRAGRGGSTHRVCGSMSATRWRSCRRMAGGSVDLVATDPPYNLQLPMTMAGGPLAEQHANRRTDYAMVTDSARRPRQRARLRDLPRADGARLRASSDACCASGATPS